MGAANAIDLKSDKLNDIGQDYFTLNLMTLTLSDWLEPTDHLVDQAAIPKDITANGDVANFHQLFTIAIHDVGDCRQFGNQIDHVHDDHRQCRDKSQGEAKLRPRLPGQYR